MEGRRMKRLHWCYMDHIVEVVFLHVSLSDRASCQSTSAGLVYIMDFPHVGRAVGQFGFQRLHHPIGNPLVISVLQGKKERCRL